MKTLTRRRVDRNAISSIKGDFGDKPLEPLEYSSGLRSILTNLVIGEPQRKKDYGMYKASQTVFQEDRIVTPCPNQVACRLMRLPRERKNLLEFVNRQRHSTKTSKKTIGALMCRNESSGMAYGIRYQGSERSERIENGGFLIYPKRMLNTQNLSVISYLAFDYVLLLAFTLIIHVPSKSDHPDVMAQPTTWTSGHKATCDDKFSS